MGLHWDVSKVADEHRLVDGEMSPVTHALIMLTLSTGIGEITEATAPEFYARVTYAERIYGSFVSVVDEDGGIKDRPITLTDVLNHVGLKTNASFDVESRAKWLKRVVGADLDRLAHDAKRAQAAAKAVER